MLKLKLDENFSHSLTQLFLDAGFDTHSVLDENLSGATDDFLFQKIKEEERCMVTFDLDFSNIIRYPTKNMEGIVVIRPNRPISLEVMENFSRQLILELADKSPKNCLWVLEENRLRIREGL